MTSAEPAADLVLEVHPARRPARWEWRLIDRRDGGVFERELEYESPSAARRAGLERLEELRSSGSGAAVCARPIAA
jgi:hypothetical protein